MCSPWRWLRARRHVAGEMLLDEAPTYTKENKELLATPARVLAEEASLRHLLTGVSPLPSRAGNVMYHIIADVCTPWLTSVTRHLITSFPVVATVRTRVDRHRERRCRTSR